MLFFIIKALQKQKKLRHSGVARLLHWIYAPAVLAGIASGFYLSGQTRATGFRSMVAAQKTHFTAQYLLLFSYLGWLYYLLTTKNYREIMPAPRDLLDLPGYLKYELFLTKKQPKYPKYNPAQKILFTGLGLLLPLQIITGLALYLSGQHHKTVAPAGGLNPLRQKHYLAALAIAAMTAGHIYFALTHSLKKLKSIFTGYE